jgi:transcriptional regulator with XRE-family HTH domain
MPLNTIVAHNLYALRIQRKLSQTAVAKAARLSVSYVSMIERGQRSPPLETLEVLAKALKITPISLFEEGSHGRTRPPRRR